MLNRFNMKMALPVFIPTLQAHSTGNHTRVDNVFCSEDLMKAITKCYTDDAKQPVKTDHYPITMILDIHMTKTELPPRFNFCKMNWPEFLPTLESNLDKLPQPAPINNVDSFNNRLTALNTAIWESINMHLEPSKPTPYSKRWWSTTLAQERKTTIKLARKAKSFRDHPKPLTPNHPIHEAHCLQRNKYSDSKNRFNVWLL